MYLYSVQLNQTCSKLLFDGWIKPHPGAQQADSVTWSTNMFNNQRGKKILIDFCKAMSYNVFPLGGSMSKFTDSSSSMIYFYTIKLCTGT